MITFDELKSMMETDSKVDRINLDSEAINIPAIHNKYLKILMDLKMDYRKAERAMQLMRKLKWEYYTGKMSKEDLAKQGWDACQLRILKTDLDIYMNSDPDLQKAQKYIDELEVKIEMIESYTKTVLNRHWMIKTAVDWQKFTHGVV